ncbi:MAG: 50S ribosomal protein L31 [Chloroflexota bacterium]|nr:MAG: 50S ribosomal protein L31 [Anaerolineaceae bacterium 4572_5.2]RLD05433.1 MAG: 50S ribosomal protein L31 [Chloroflexota bacterium]
MKKDIHPTYYPEAKVTCACGNTWTTGSTKESIHTDICSKCHPFYTGEQRIVDTEGQVERFYRKLKAREDYLKQQESREQAKVSADVSLEELDFGSRVNKALEDAEFKTVANLLETLEGGEQALLDIKGIGHKSLIDIKKALRGAGYKIPEAAEEIAV